MWLQNLHDSVFEYPNICMLLIFHRFQCKSIDIVQISFVPLYTEKSPKWRGFILMSVHHYAVNIHNSDCCGKTSAYFNAFVLSSTLKNQQQQQHSLCLFAAPSSQNGFGRCFFLPNFFYAGGVCKTRTEVDLHWIVRCCFMPCLNKLARQCFPCCYRRYFGKQNVCDSMCTGFQIKMTILQCMSK